MSDHVRLRSTFVTCSRTTLAIRTAAILATLPILIALASPAFAQSDAAAADNLTKLRQDWLKQVARQDVASWEIDLISTPRTNGLTVGSLGDPSAVLKELRPNLSGDYDAIRSGLFGLTAKAKARVAEVEKDWAEVCRQRAAFRQYADMQQTAFGFDFDSGTPAGFKPNLLDAVLLGWGVTVLVVALLLRKKEHRLAIRRARRTAAAALLLSLAMLPGCSASSSDQRSWAEREQTNLTAAIKDATEKADAAINAANVKWQASVDHWARLVTAPSDSVDATVQREEIGEGGRGGLRDRLRAIALDARLAEVMAKDTEDQRNKLTDERSKLEGLVAGSKWRAIAFTSVRVAIAACLFSITIAPFWTARRARRAAVRLASRTCPRCFRRDTLKVEKTAGSSPEPKWQHRGRRARPTEEPEPEENEDTEVRCTKCGLRIRRSYLRVPRLCFPTVGVRSSGKTHMLVTAYDRVRRRTAPTAAVVQPAPSGSDIDKRFDRLIEEILHRRGEAGATDLVLPDPVLVHVKDTDPAGGNPALINLFDYSGELINPDVDVNQLKATAVRMDGFMLFLDPTQLYGDGANVTLDEQLGMLDQFLAHMRKERKVPVGGSIPVPVAVCIPKFDLLVTENPVGGQSIPFIRHLLENLNPPPREVTLDVIQARSDLVEQMLPLMFPGANVRDIIEGYFGKQVMFFPMSSVGLYEHELGIKDLARRTITPYGVAEPLFWLLYMHGYEVFA